MIVGNNREGLTAENLAQTINKLTMNEAKTHETMINLIGQKLSDQLQLANGNANYIMERLHMLLPYGEPIKVNESGKQEFEGALGNLYELAKKFTEVNQKLEMIAKHLNEII